MIFFIIFHNININTLMLYRFNLYLLYNIKKSNININKEF